jgi:hypothetical protein
MKVGETDSLVLTLFNWRKISYWRKPTCLDGLVHPNFRLNTDLSDPYGRTQPTDNAKAVGFREIVNMVRPGWEIEFQEHPNNPVGPSVRPFVF